MKIIKAFLRDFDLAFLSFRIRLNQRFNGGMKMKKFKALVLIILSMIASILLWNFKLQLIAIVGNVIFYIVFTAVTAYFVWRAIIFVGSLLNN